MKSKRSLRIGLAIAGVALAVYGLIYAWTYNARNYERFQELIDGGEGVYITELDFTFQRRQVICRDPETLNYFLGVLRGEDQGGFGGTTYRVCMKCSDSRSISAHMYVNEKTISVSLGCPEWNWGDLVCVLDVAVPDDGPTNFRTMLDFLNAPYQTVEGQKLILHEDGRVEKVKL